MWRNEIIVHLGPTYGTRVSTQSRDIGEHRELPLRQTARDGPSLRVPGSRRTSRYSERYTRFARFSVRLRGLQTPADRQVWWAIGTCYSFVHDRLGIRTYKTMAIARIDVASLIRNLRPLLISGDISEEVPHRYRTDTRVEVAGRNRSLKFLFVVVVVAIRTLGFPVLAETESHRTVCGEAAVVDLTSCTVNQSDWAHRFLTSGG